MDLVFWIEEKDDKQVYSTVCEAMSDMQEKEKRAKDVPMCANAPTVTHTSKGPDLGSQA